MTRGKMNDEIRRPEVLTEIGKCVSTGMNWSALKEHLKKQFKIETDVRTIKNVYDTYVMRRGEVFAGHKELQMEVKKEVEETILDTKASLKKIHKFVDNMMDRAQGEDDRLALDCAREILNQLYFQEKLLNKMQTGINVQNLNKLEITQIVVKQLDDLEKSGQIKIIDPSLIEIKKVEDEKNEPEQSKN
jgi:hypothetical protein